MTMATDANRSGDSANPISDITGQYQSMIDGMTEAIVIIDRRGRIVQVNPAANAMYGYNRGELIGQAGCGIIDSDCHDLFAGAWQKEIYSGQYIGESINRRKNGQEIDVEVNAGMVILSGEPHLILQIRDITCRKTKDEHIRRLIHQYTAMINTVPAIMYIKDCDLAYVEVNEAFCRQAGRPREEIVGRTDKELGLIETLEREDGEDRQIVIGAAPQINREEKITDAKGEAKWISTAKVPLLDDRGVITGLVGLLQDVTEHHLSREQLIQADKLAAIGILAAGVAHEINNPMGYISSNLNTMSKYLEKVKIAFNNKGVGKEPEAGKLKEMLDDFGEAIEESLEGAGRVKKIVADLKSFSRIDRAEVEYANINDGFESTLNIVWNELKYKCKVVKELGDLPDLLCIPNQINQVLMNLLVNAGHAISETGTITVKTWADDDYIHLSIRDTGQGIPPENLNRIFEPFYTTKEVGTGTGLGLSLVYDIVEKHQGTIDVTSEVGIGTEFIVNLPRSKLNELT